MSKTPENANSHRGVISTAVAVPANPTQTIVLPEFVRIPSKGREPWTGLSRSQIYQLIGSGAIKSVSLRRGGTTRGTRLICLKSLFDFLNSRIESGKNNSKAHSVNEFELTNE